MKKRASIVAAFSASVITLSVNAADNIDVLLALTPSAIAHGSDPFASAADYESAIQGVIDASGMPGRNVTVFAYPLPTTTMLAEYRFEEYGLQYLSNCKASVTASRQGIACISVSGQ